MFRPRTVECCAWICHHHWAAASPTDTPRGPIPVSPTPEVTVAERKGGKCCVLTFFLLRNQNPEIINILIAEVAQPFS